MKVLLINPSYPQTFWSMNKVLQRLGKKILEPPLGLLTMAALLPKSWDLRLVELTAREVSEKEWTESEVVMVTGMGVQSPGILQTIQEARGRGKTVVVGGPWAFHYPENALKAGANIVVRGEAELAMPLLLDALSQGESGRIVQAMDRPDLRDFPMPRYDLLDINLYAQMDIQFSRGCPFQCEFCDITNMYGRQVRTKSPAQILRELQIFYDMGWRRYVFFVDDNLIGNPARAKTMLEEVAAWMEKRDHPFELCFQASVNLARHPELLNLLVRAGFYKVFLGIETPDKESLELAKKRQNLEVDLDEVCRTITAAGLIIIAGCIIGFDNEKPGADRRLIEFAVRNKIPEMFISLLQVGPGTDLYQRMAREGRLLSGPYDVEIGNQTAMMNFVPTRPVSEIVEELITLYNVLYQPENYMERTYEHFLGMKTLPVRRSFSPPYPREFHTAGMAILKQGVLYPSRWKFWHLFFKALLRFPRRFPHYISLCVLAEHYYEYRHIIETVLRSKLALWHPLPNDKSAAMAAGPQNREGAAVLNVRQSSIGQS